MFKLLKFVITFLFIVIVILCLGVFIFIKTLDINRFKDQITQQISKSMNRDVSMRHVSFNFSIGQGVTLDISGLTIMDHHEFSSDPMVYVDSAHLNLDIVPLLFKRQIFISEIKLDSLNVNIVRNSSGAINFQQLSEPFKEETNDIQVNNKTVKLTDTPLKTPEIASQKTLQKKVKDFAFGDLLVRSIHIKDGALVFTDQTMSPAMTIPVTEIELRISNLSLNTVFPFHITASLWSERKNVQINGLAQINALNQQVRIDDLKIQTNLSDLSLDRIYNGIPSLKETGLEGNIDGQFVIDIHQMILGEEGLVVLALEGQLTNGKIPFKNSPVPVENLNMHFEISESDLEIKEIEMPIASGSLNITSRIVDYLAEQKFAGNLVLKDVQLSELAEQVDFPVKMEGDLHGSLKASGKGFDKEALELFLSGEGTVEVKEGRVVDINILKLVLNKLSFIPNLDNRVEENLPVKYKKKLKQKDTILEKVKIVIQVQNGTLMINRAEINADGFLVLARGKLTFDQHLNLEADLYISSDLSASMVASVPELSFLLDERNQIRIPFKPYDGALAKFRMYPDIEDLGKNFIRSKGREELQKMIYKALGRETQVPNDSTEGKIPTQENKDVRPEDAIIENILDLIPIFK